MPQNFVIVRSTNYKILTQHTIWKVPGVVVNNAGRRTAGRRTTGRQGVGRRTTGQTGRRTNGRKSDGRKSVAQCQRSPRRSSLVNFVVMAMATWSCSGASSRCYNTTSSRCYNTASSRCYNTASSRRYNTASSRRYNTASSHRYNAAARVAAMLRHYCSMCRGSVAAMLQLALLRHCCNRRCGNAAALRRYCSPQQWRKAAHYATMASASSARDNGRQGYAAL